MNPPFPRKPGESGLYRTDPPGGRDAVDFFSAKLLTKLEISIYNVILVVVRHCNA